MNVITARVGDVASQAGSIPGADPALLARINSLAGQIDREYKKSEGMNLDAVTASSKSLTGNGRKKSLGRGIGGIFLDFIQDVLVKILSNEAADWLESVGISVDEASREEAESTQSHNTEELCRTLEQCCDSIKEVDSTADTAISGVLEVLSALLMVMKIHPFFRVVSLVLPLVVEGLEQIRDIVTDRNEHVRGSLDEVIGYCESLHEHQPAPSKQWDCPDVAPTVSPGPPAVSSDPPLPPAAVDCDSEAAPTTPRHTESATPDVAERLVTEPVAPVAAPDLPTSAASMPQDDVLRGPQQCISFDYSFDGRATLDAAAHAGSTAGSSTIPIEQVGCELASRFCPPAQSASSSMVGVLGQIGLSATLEGLTFLGESLAALTECPGQECEIHGISDGGDQCEQGDTPAKAVVDVPEQPAPEPVPEQPPLAEGTIAPPPELAGVEQPPVPIEKLKAAGLATGLEAPDAAEANGVDAEQPSELPTLDAPETPEAAASTLAAGGAEDNEAPEVATGARETRMKRTGEW